MLDSQILEKYIAEYKNIFGDRYKNETAYLWEAVQNFQRGFNIKADNFGKMLGFALRSTDKLLVLHSDYRANNPKKMILFFARAFPEEMAACFRDLYDERKLVSERLANFRAKTSALRSKWNQNEENYFKFFINYQSVYIIYCYLFLRYPQKYFIYQTSMFHDAALILQSSYTIDPHKVQVNLANAHNFMLELQKALRQDQELIDIVKNTLNKNAYPDPNLHILTSDFAYFLKTQFRKIAPELASKPIILKSTHPKNPQNKLRKGKVKPNNSKNAVDSEPKENGPKNKQPKDYPAKSPKIKASKDLAPQGKMSRPKASKNFEAQGKGSKIKPPKDSAGKIKDPTLS